jgi:nitronate monooxygenase
MQTLQLLSLLKTRWPLIQAPMAGVQGSQLTIAVSQSGALGSLPCAMLTAEQIAHELRTIQASGVTAYNVNFFCHVNPPLDADRQAAWRKLLQPYYTEHGIDPASVPIGAGRQPFSAAVCDAIEPFKPPVVSFHFGLPAPDLIQRVKAWGSVVISSATTLAEAQWLEKHGADIIIAQGLEAGGHRATFLLHHEFGAHAGLSSTHPHDWSQELSTQLPTLRLVPQIAAAVRVPVIAAGGIVDAASARVALALGASGVQVGTAYMLCPEATTSAVHRAALMRSAANPAAHHTQLTTLFTGRPARGITNRIMRELGPLNITAPPFPNATAAIAPLRSAAERQGLDDFSPLWAGHNASGCTSQPAADITTELAKAFI